MAWRMHLDKVKEMISHEKINNKYLYKEPNNVRKCIGADKLAI
jgi:hypothetical protein